MKQSTEQLERQVERDAALLRALPTSRLPSESLQSVRRAVQTEALRLQRGRNAIRQRRLFGIVGGIAAAVLFVFGVSRNVDMQPSVDVRYASDQLDTWLLAIEQSRDQLRDQLAGNFYESDLDALEDWSWGELFYDDAYPS